MLDDVWANGRTAIEPERRARHAGARCRWSSPRPRSGSATRWCAATTPGTGFGSLDRRRAVRALRPRRRPRRGRHGCRALSVADFRRLYRIPRRGGPAPTCDGAAHRHAHHGRARRDSRPGRSARSGPGDRDRAQPRVPQPDARPLARPRLGAGDGTRSSTTTASTCRRSRAELLVREPGSGLRRGSSRGLGSRGARAHAAVDLRAARGRAQRRPAWPASARGSSPRRSTARSQGSRISILRPARLAAALAPARDSRSGWRTCCSTPRAATWRALAPAGRLTGRLKARGQRAATALQATGSTVLPCPSPPHTPTAQLAAPPRGGRPPRPAPRPPPPPRRPLLRALAPGTSTTSSRRPGCSTSSTATRCASRRRSAPGSRPPRAG